MGPGLLACAFFLDLAIGDPRWLPHPVQIIGKGIAGLENLLRRVCTEKGERVAGIFLVIAIVLPTFVLAFILNRVLLSFSDRLIAVIGTIALIYLVSTTLALRGLVTSARLVTGALKKQEIAEAREKLAMIVGRDTRDLGEEAIVRATIETLAENLSDGVIAPLCYLTVGGLPLAAAYKAINTLDSMVGYKNTRYVRFGWAAARLDDAANYIPARIAGAAIACAAFLYFLTRGGKDRKKPGAEGNCGVRERVDDQPTPTRIGAASERRSEKRLQKGRVLLALSRAYDSWRIMRRDGRNHTSPNSGVPEAAMAGALGMRLGGASTYGGMVVEKPYIGDEGSDDYLASADRAVHLVVTASCLAAALAVAILGLGRFL